MASTPAIIQEDSSVQSKAPILPVTIAVVLGVVLSVAIVGGAGYYLIHAGKLRLQTMPPVPPQRLSEQKTYELALEPLVVNLADSSGSAYLRTSILLNIADESEQSLKEAKKEETGKGGSRDGAAVRDAALAVLGRQTSDSLLAPEGKERLKGELKQALSEHVPTMKVVDLYFTEFLVQR